MKRKVDYDRYAVEYCKRYLNSRVQRLLGMPAMDTPKPSEYDGYHLCICPFSQVIKKFSRCTGKREKILVPCGRCLYCKHRQQNKLIFRLYNHMRMYNNSIFVTLTYNDLHYTDDPILLREDITLFLKRFRKELQDKTFSYYMVCERGDLRNRCHFHLLMFWNGSSNVSHVVNIIKTKWYGFNRVLDPTQDYVFTSLGFIPKSSNGFIYVEETCNSDIASYVSKYVSGTEKKLVFRSWSLGLGADILAVDDILTSQFRHLGIIKYTPSDKTYSVAVPSYYKNKVFSQSERDVFFMDYLVSESYAKKWEFYEDPVLYLNLLDVYQKYEVRWKNTYELRKRIKANKKRLL